MVAVLKRVLGVLLQHVLDLLLPVDDSGCIVKILTYFLKCALYPLRRCARCWLRPKEVAAAGCDP